MVEKHRIPTPPHPVLPSNQVIRPAKLWCDTESAPEAAELAAKLGWGVVASFTISKVLWLKRHEPASYAKLVAGGRLALPHDYLNLQLTGNLVRRG